MRTRTQNSTTQGYSLIEMLFYITLLIAGIVIAVTVLVSFAQSLNTFLSSRDVGHGAAATLERFVREVRNADAVDIVESVFDTHPGRLTVNAGALITEFYLDGGVLKIRENGVEKGSLTSQTVSVDSLVFRSLNGVSARGVRIEMTLSSKRGKATTTKFFYSFAVLRGAY